MASKAISTSEPEAIRITFLLATASAKTYAPILTMFLLVCFVLTVRKPCLVKESTDGVVLVVTASSQASAVSTVSAGRNTQVFGVARDMAKCSTG